MDAPMIEIGNPEPECRTPESKRIRTLGGLPVNMMSIPVCIVEVSFDDSQEEMPVAANNAVILEPYNAKPFSPENLVNQYGTVSGQPLDPEPLQKV